MSVQQLAMQELFVAIQPAIGAARGLRSCARKVVPRRELVITVLAILLAASSVWFLTNRDAKIHSLDYSIDQLQGQVQQMNAANAWMSAQVDEMQEPTHILNIAVGQLHMQFAAPVHISADSNQLPNTQRP
jgi:cell division protein FtsB